MILRIFYVIDSFKVGGAQRQLLELVRNLDKRRYQVAICPIWDIPELESSYLETGAEIVHIHKHFSTDFTVAFRLAQRMRWFRPHIVHTWLFTGSLWGRVAAILAKSPVIITGERTIVPDGKQPGFILTVNHILARWTDVITANSQVGITTLVRQGFLPKQLRCIYNGVDTHQFSLQKIVRHRVSVREQLGIDGAPVCITIGRLTEQKGQPVLLQAIRRILDAGEIVKCIIVGQGDQREMLEMYASKIGVQSNVLFLGKRDDIDQVLSAADIFSLPSYWEGMPNVVLEAMAMGLPVVASAVAGTTEVVVEGETGFLIPPGDPDNLAERLLRLIRDPELRTRMGSAGRQRVVSEFSLEQMVAQTTALYEELIEKKQVNA